MGRKLKYDYADIARNILEEQGGGPMSFTELVDTAIDRNLVEEDKWLKVNFVRNIKASEQFDTTSRGQVALLDRMVLEPTTEAEIPVSYEPEVHEAVNNTQEGVE